MQYSGSNIVEGVAESWVEAEMRWVEVGAWFSNTQKVKNAVPRTYVISDLNGEEIVGTFYKLKNYI